MSCKFETKDANINSMFSIFEGIEGMALDSFDISNEKEMGVYKYVANLLIQKEQDKITEALKEGEPVGYLYASNSMLLSNESLKTQLSVLAKDRKVTTNAEKINLYLSVLNRINMKAFKKPLHKGIVSDIENNMASIDEAYAASLQAEEKKKEAENTTTIPNLNAASVFGVRPFKYSVNLGYFHNEPYQGTEQFKSVYQAMVYFKYINAVGKNGIKSEVIKEILDTTDADKLTTLWESYSITDNSILKRWQQNIKRLITEIFVESFNENPNNKESIRQAMSFLSQSKDKLASENSDGISSYYNVLLSFYKTKLLTEYANKDRKVSFNDNVTIDTIKANPQSVYVISRQSELYKDVKEKEAKGEKFDNIVSIETEQDISNSEKVDVPSYYDGNIEKDDDVIMVYGSNQLGINGAGNALSAKNQGRIGEKERVVNRISESGRAYGLNTVEAPHKPLNTAQIINNIKILYETAKENPDKVFAVAYTNVGNVKSLNGYTGSEMISMFLKAGPIPPNIKFSRQWIETDRFGVEKYKKDIDNLVEQIKGIKGDIVIANNPTVEDKNTRVFNNKTAYNAYFNKQLSQLAGSKELTVEDEAIKLLTAMEKKSSYDKVLSAFNTLKLQAFDALRNIDAKVRYDIPAYLKNLLLMGNNYVRIDRSQTADLSEGNTFDPLNNIASILHSYIINNDFKGLDENERALLFEYLNWFKPKVNSRTMAIVYVPARSFFANEKQYIDSINRTIENAEYVLKNGGFVLTLDHESLSSKVGEIARKEDSNKIVWNKLFEKGYRPSSFGKGFHIDAWATKEILAGEDEELQKKYDDQMARLKKKLTELKTFEPSVTTNSLDNIIDNEIIVSNNMFTKLEDNINNGIVTFQDTDPLYEQILGIQDTILNNPTKQHRVRFILEGVIYYANVTPDNFILNDDSVSIQADFERTRINGYFDVDVSFKNQFNNPTEIEETHNPNIILGSEKAAEYIDDITEKLVEFILADIDTRKDEIRTRIEEIEERLVSLGTVKLMEKYNNGEDYKETEEETALNEELINLKKELKNLNNGNFAEFINNKDYVDEDGTTKKLGIESWVKEVVADRYEYYANLNEEDAEYEYDQLVKFLISLNDNYATLSDEAKTQFEKDVAEEATKITNARTKAAQDIITYLDDILPYVYKNISSRINIKINTFRDSSASVESLNDDDDNSFNTAITDYYENEDALVPVTDEEFVFRDNYQAELLNIAKSVSFEVKRKLFERVLVRSDNATTSFCKINSFGKLSRRHRDDVYNFLREKLNGLHTLADMIKWIETYVRSGHFEYASLLRTLKNAPKDLQSKFFCCMYTQKVNRNTHLNSNQLGGRNPNKIVDDIKDLRQVKMKQMTVLNLNTQNVICEDKTLNLVGIDATKRENHFNNITSMLKKTYTKFTNANTRYRENLKKLGYTEEVKLENNIFTSSDAADVAVVEEVINNLRKSLQAIGISITNQQLRIVITSREKYDELQSILTKNEHSGIFASKNVINIMKDDLTYDNFKFGYDNLFEFLSPMYEGIPQKGTVHAAGKDFATYMYPSFASLLWENLNDNSEDPVTHKRRNLDYIEKNYMQHPIFYKEDNIDDIVEYVKQNANESKEKYEFLSVFNKEAIKKSVIDDMYDSDTKSYVIIKDNITKYVKTKEEIPLWYITEKIYQKAMSILDENKKILPDFCPELETGVWRNEWLKTIYLNYANTHHKLKGEKWNKLQTILLTMSNGKEYKDLKGSEFMQFLIDNYVTVARRTKNHFGAFYSPMVSDAEVCRTEVFLNLHVSTDDKKYATENNLDPLCVAAARKLQKIVEGEIELRKNLYDKFTHRIEAYHRYNEYVKSLPVGATIDKPLMSFKGYSEFIADFDIAEKPLTYKKAENGLAIIDLGGITDDMFDSEGNLLYPQDDTVIERIKSFNGYTYNYVNYNPAKGSLFKQCYEELEKQFYTFLHSLDKNTTIPGKYGNYRVFEKEEKKTEEEIVEEDLEKSNAETDIVESDENIEAADEFQDEDDLYAFVEDNERLEKEEVVRLRDSIIPTINKAALRELQKFFFNQAYANTQLQQLFNTSPSFYKGGNPVEVQKRGKEHNTPMQRLDLSNFTRPYERVVYLKDLKIDNIDEAINDIIDSSENLTATEKANIKRAFKGMKITDGQAFRSPESYIKIQKGLGRWNDDMQAAYDRLCDPKIPVSYSDMMMLAMNPIKGFTFSMENVNLTDKYSLPMPVQHKDSEYTLLFGIAKARMKDNSVLQGLAEFMSEKDADGDCKIDAAIFGTAVKVGGMGAVDLTKCKTSEDAKEVLNKACYYNGNLNKSVVHEIPWKDYGIVSETPEHFFEEEALFGTQIRRIMYGDLQLDKVYEFTDELNGTTTKMTGQQIIDKYSSLIEENLKEAFDDLLDLFFTQDKGIEASAKLENYLLREVTGNPLYPQDIADYCKFDRRKTFPDGRINPNYGKFTKLSNPKNYAKVQQLLLSLFKNRITKQKIAGGSCVQVSVAYDYEDLKLVTKDAVDSEGNVIIDEKTNKPKKVIEYAECYLPAYLESIYRKFLKKDGTINLDKMKKKLDAKTYYALTNMIGYRIPTEGLSSTIKLKVKGFLTGYTGSSIILPKEIVTLSGSDFDIDKLYIHRYAFRTKNGYPQLIVEAETEEEKTDARNNQLITMMMGIMTLPENNMLMLKPQGFDNLKKSAMISNILSNPQYKDKYTVSQLRDMETSELEKMTNFEDNLSFLNPATHVYFQQQNMIGKSLLGVWAVAKSAHCLFERSGLYLKKQYRFSYGENTFVKPDPITVKKNGINTYVSVELGSYIGASADNAKDPVLAKLGITKDNINIVVYLARLGLDSTSIAIMLKNRFFSKSSLFKLAYDAGATKDNVDLMVEELENSVDDEWVNKIVFTDDLMQEANKSSDILDNEETVRVDMNDGTSMLITRQQLAVVMNKLYRNVVSPASDQLNQLTLSVRADSQNGAVFSNMAATMSRIQQMESSEKKLNNKDLSIFVYDPDGESYADGERNDGTPFFTTSFTGLNPSEDIDTKAAFVQKFMNYGVLAVRDLMRDKLPHFGATFRNAFEIGYHTKNGYISEDNAKKLERALYYYHLGNLPFFGDEETIDKKTGQKVLITKDSKIDFYRDNMINIYGQMLTKYPELSNNLFISLLSPDDELSESDIAKGKIRTLRMPNSNLFTIDTKVDVQNAFLQLLTSKNSDIRDFAWDLVRYGFYRYGFGFLPDGYMHLIPNEVFDSLEGYEDMLNRLLEVNEKDAINNGLFIEDFILNNMSMIKSLNTMPWKDYIALTKEKKPDEIADIFQKRYGEIPPYMCFTSWNEDEQEVAYTLMHYNSKARTYFPCKKTKENSTAKENKYFVKYRYYKNQPMVDITGFANFDKQSEQVTNIYEASQFMAQIITDLKTEDIAELGKEKLGDEVYNNLIKQGQTALEELSRGGLNGYEQFLDLASKGFNLDNADPNNSQSILPEC